MLKWFKVETADDFYASVGFGAIGAQQVIMRLGVVDDSERALPTVAPPTVVIVRPAGGARAVRRGARNEIHIDGAEFSPLRPSVSE